MITIDFTRLDIRPGDRILDMGCGEGRHMVQACRKSGTCCIGADLGHDNLAATRDKLHFHQSMDDLACTRFDLSCMDVTGLPFRDKSVDVVICSEVLEHIPDDDQAVSELVRVLKPGRILAVSVPRFLPEKICWLLSDAYRNADMGHVRIYRKKELTAKITAKNMVLLGSHFAHSIHTPYWWLKCLAGPDRTDVTLVNLYHQLLVWDMMKKPGATRFFDRLLNPVLGKSLVLYFKKV
ncbi:MAG: methyltransferase domain-containing protein [Desulfotignum sp.]|nr:methyltransferase domain-containing protein [Desulfotignum sp.]MCF8125430.1 methyltransferase domain-containing protein [Desulfotignum sp.]